MAAFALVGALFGSLAAVMAFLIVFGEFQSHRLRAGRAWAEGLRAAALAFAVIFLGAMAAGLILLRAL